MAKKAVYKSAASGLTVEFEYDTQKSLFENLAEFQDVFEENVCGKCKKTNTKFSVREIDSNKYYEKKCGDCGHSLSYGQNKVGGSLFPKRRNDDGSWDNETKGWKKWTPNRDTEQVEPAKTTPTKGKGK